MSQLHSNAEVTRSTLSDESLITSKQLRELLGGCSEMQVWRLLNDEKIGRSPSPNRSRLTTETIGNSVRSGNGSVSGKSNRKRHRRDHCVRRGGSSQPHLRIAVILGRKSGPRSGLAATGSAPRKHAAISPSRLSND